MKYIKVLTISLLCIFLLTGCNSKKYDGELNVLNWSSYIPNSIINDFEKETNIKVNYSTYSSNEELLAKISSSKEGTYDLIFPSDYMVDLMISKNMLEKMDKNKLENYKNINPLFLGQPFDKKNKYSMPFLLATTVIAVNREHIKDKISSYNDLLNPKYRRNIVLLDDQRVTIGMALLANGYSMNDTSKKGLNEAKNWLLEMQKNTKAFDSDSPKTFLITKETDLGVMWNAEAIIARDGNKKIEIIYPKEGHALSLDNYCLVKGIKNKDNAYKFIDYLLEKEVNKQITDEYPYINTTKKAQNVNDTELIHILNDGYYVKNIGNKISLYDKLWAEIK